jgi:hypothetical protein
VEVRAAQSLVFCVVFCRSLFVLLFFFFCPLHCLSFDLRLLITPLVSSDYPFGIFWLPLWYRLITPLVSSDYPFGILSFDYHFGIFWLPLWCFQTCLTWFTVNKYENVHRRNLTKTFRYRNITFIYILLTTNTENMILIEYENWKFNSFFLLSIFKLDLLYFQPRCFLS